MNKTICAESVVAASKDAVSAELDQEVVILNLKNDVYYGLDNVGRRVWDLLREPSAIGKIRDAIVEEFDVESEVCERELLAFVDELLREGLIEVRD